MSAEDTGLPFGLLLRRARHAAGMTQETLAERANLSWRTISDLERGVKHKPHRDTLLLLAEALGMGEPERHAFEAAARGVPRADTAPRDEVQRVALPTGYYLGALPSTRMVAREEESARIAAGLEAATVGQGHLLLVSGEPGVGKTRLAQEAMLWAREKGCIVLMGRCYEEHATSPYFPFLDVLAMAWTVAPSELHQVATQRYAELGRLLPGELHDTAMAADGTAHSRLLGAVAGFLRDLAATAPLALLLDDLHWSDGASLDLLLHLTRALHGRRVFLLGSFRELDSTSGYPLAEALARLVGEGLGEMVSLSPLSLQGTAAQIGALLGMTRNADELAALVHQRTAGNPFFTTEVLKALLEQGALYQQGEHWERVALEEMQAPFSVRMVVAQRVGRLPRETQDLLRLASVLGQEFEFEVLLAAAGQDEEAVLTAMDEVLAARLLEERRYGQQERYAFVHALVAQVLHDELPRYRLRRLHLRAAEALVRARGDRPEVAAEVARHFLAGGNEARAVGYLEQAGDHAARLYAYAEAISHYRQALQIWQRGDDRAALARVQRRLGMALARGLRLEEANNAHLAEARDVLEEARATLEAMGETVELALVHQALAWAQGLDARASLPHMEQALALWPQERADRDLLQILVGMADALGGGVGDFAAAAPYAERAAALAGQLGDLPAQLSIVVRDTTTRFERGVPTTAMLALLDRVDVVARRAGDGAAQHIFTWLRGFTYMLAGRLRESWPFHLQAAEIARQDGVAASQALALGTAAETAMALGEWQEVRTLGGQASMLQPLGVHELCYRWASGDHAEAILAGERGVADMRRRGLVKYLLAALAFVADAYLQLGRTEEAAQFAHDAVQLMREHGLWGLTGRTRGPLAEVVALLGTPDTETILIEAETGVAHYEQFLARPQLLRARSVLLARQGRREEALAALRHSAEVARDQGARVELARTLSTLASVARETGDTTAMREADIARRAIVMAIGPATAGLNWAL